MRLDKLTVACGLTGGDGSSADANIVLGKGT